MTQDNDDKKGKTPKLKDKKQYEQVIAKLSKHFEDRTEALRTTFKAHANKPSGSSAGYIGKRQSDQKSFMIKDAYKKAAIIDDKHAHNSMQLVNEFVMGPLYQRLLYDRTPIIESVKDEDEKSHLIALRSKFLEGFETVSQYTKSHLPYSIGDKDKDNHSKLKDVKGAEKLFAAMLAGGEYDKHAGNVGVQIDKSTEAKDDKSTKAVFSKIDHGFSATQFYTDPYAMWGNISEMFRIGNRYGYAGKLNFNVSTFRDSLEQMSKISAEEIENILSARIALLEKTGLDITGLNFPIWMNDTINNHKINRSGSVSFENFEELKTHYIKNFKQRQMK